MNWLINTVIHHKPKVDEADIYGAIIYTDEHVFVKKLIQDNDYWEALDKISGAQWAIFSTRVKKGNYERESSMSGDKSYMVAVWKEPEENEGLLEVFQIKSTESLPLFVVFALDKSGQPLKREFKIHASSVESTFELLREILAHVGSSISRINNENLRNTL